MCEACASDLLAMPKAARRKLWEIESGWHCMILGTCLTMPELRAQAAKHGLQTKRTPAPDYEIHATMVHWVSRNRVLGKAIHKLLDRKYAVAVTRLGKIADTAGLAIAWSEAVERGEVAGTLWALMSHPAATIELQTTVFGEVHMLSHQVGAASRADLRRLKALETEKAALEDKVARQQGRLREEVSARDGTIRALRGQLEHDRAELRSLAQAATATAEVDGLRTLATELQRRLEIEAAARRSGEAARRGLEDLLSDATRDLARCREEAATLREENAALEGRLLMAFGPARPAGCDLDCGRPDLCGRCILYVGGRAHQVQHLKRIVEECNGTFVHHDGGCEDNMGRLSGLLGQADTVLFPVDCVSHMAHDQLKRLCKRWEKPFLPIRSSGLGSFIRALDTVQGSAMAGG